MVLQMLMWQDSDAHAVRKCAWYRALMGAAGGVTGWNDGDAGRFGFALGASGYR